MTLEPADPVGLRQHAELRQLARRFLRGERRDHTLAPTDLVHEAWVRLGRGRNFVAAARVMREVLIDHARRRSAAKRSGGRRVEMPDPEAVAIERDAYVIALDEALADLAQIDPELSAVVELRFFGGASVEETAAALELSPRTVKRRWQLAKAWLHREILGR